MDKQGVYGFLESEGIPFEATEHEAVWNMEDLARVELPHPGRDAKNLFVRDDKKRAYYLITVNGSTRVDLKEFRSVHGTRALSFASDSDLGSILGLFPGAVTPFGLLNDPEHRAELFLDSWFLEGDGLIGVHPNDNTATVWMRAEDLVSLLERRGTKVSVVPLRGHPSRRYRRLKDLPIPNTAGYSIGFMFGVKWCQFGASLVPNGAKWCQMVPNGAKWCQRCQAEAETPVCRETNPMTPAFRPAREDRTPSGCPVGVR